MSLASFLKMLMKGIFWLCAASYVLFGGSMRWFFTLIRTFQIVLHLPMVRVVVPTCVIYSYSIVIPIVKWDIFEDQFKSESTQSQGSRIYQQMQLLGYDSNQTLDNLDSITIFLVVYILKVIFLLGLKVVRYGYGNNHKF